MYLRLKFPVLLLVTFTAFLFSPRTLQVSEAQTPPGRSLIAVWAVVRTGTVSDAGSDDGFQLVVQQTWKSDDEVTFRSGSYSWNENEPGRTETYGWDLRSSAYRRLNLRDSDFLSNVCIEAVGSDAWFVQSVWVMGRTADGNNVLLAGNPYFNQWLSRDSAEGNSSLSVNGASPCLEVIF